MKPPRDDAEAAMRRALAAIIRPIVVGQLRSAARDEMLLCALLLIGPCPAIPETADDTVSVPGCVSINSPPNAPFSCFNNWTARFNTAAASNQAPPLAVPPPEAPGVIASSDEAEVCGRDAGGLTYSQAHRHTIPAMKAAAHRGIASCGEMDHRLPLALGGADDVRNLWCQPAGEFEVKDRLETRVWEMVCHEHSMTLGDAQKLFLAPADWRQSYAAVFHNEPGR